MESFVNGIIAGAGGVLAIMSFALMEMARPLEGVLGFTAIEFRVGTLLGAIVCVVAIGYEHYRKKETKEQDKKTDQVTEEKHTTVQKDEKLDE